MFCNWCSTDLIFHLSIECVCMRGLVCERESVCVSRFVFDCAVALQDFLFHSR